MVTSQPDVKEQSSHNPEADARDHRASISLSAEQVDQLLGKQALFAGWALERVGSTRATHSETLRYQSAAGRGHMPIVVKRTTASNAKKAAESVTREFRALEIAWNLEAGAFEGSLPKPLMALPGHRLLVTEMLPGVTLSQVLRRSINYLMAPFRAADVCEISRKIGVWLNRFHRATRQPALPHDPQAFEREVAQQLQGCTRRNLSAPASEEMFRISSHASWLVAGQPLSAAARHGDFTPRNILISGDRIGVIDFENFAECATIYEDVGKFVAFLRLLKGRPGYSRTALDSVTLSFLEGYGPGIDRKLVDLFAVKAAVRIFAHRGVRRAERSVGLDGFYVRRLIRLGRELRQSMDLPA